MGTNTGTIMTLANSIIGVSVLAMPFCFKQCGIVLSILMLIASSLLSRLACHFLLKSAVMARRRTFEFLAFHTFGSTGKFTVELFIIGFLMGTCIAFFVVMGDLGPAIVAKILSVPNKTALRPSVLIGLAAFVVFPLGLLRNVDSLSSVSMATIGFYVCLVLKVIGESLPHLLAGDWYEHVYFWRPAGVLQCIPIFSMALFCQTQLFEIYESMHNASLDRMNFVIRAACNICTGVYICVGFFGYVAFCTQPFSGNVLMSFTPSIVSEMIKLGFVLSVAVSFPLVIFPCRASLYSLLFRRITMPHHEGVGSHIPEARFKCLTLFIIIFALIIGLLIPNIELVLGLVGSTIGVFICVMFPAAAFICMSTKSSNDRLLAQVLLFTGALILVLGTYATLNSASEAKPTEIPLIDKAPAVIDDKIPHFHEKVDNSLADLPPKLEQKAEPEAKVAMENDEKQAVIDAKPAPLQAKEKKIEISKVDTRQEPPVPVEPAVQVPTVISLVKEEKIDVKDTVKDPEKAMVKITEDKPIQKDPVKAEPEKKEEKTAGVEQVDQEAIKKEEEELAEAEKRAKAAGDSKNEEILRKLEKHEAQQIKILEEQKQILQALQEHQQKDHLKENQENIVKNLSQNKNLESAVVKMKENLDNQKEEKYIDQKPANTDIDKLLSVKLVKKPDLLQQIANGELKKMVEPVPPKEVINQEKLSQPIERVVKNVPVNNKTSINNNPPVIIAEIKESQHIAAPNIEPKAELSAGQPQPLLLERLKSPPLPVAMNKTKPFIPVVNTNEKPQEPGNEINAMRREILQEVVASTQTLSIAKDVKDGLQNTNKIYAKPDKQDLHDREKRDTESEEKLSTRLDTVEASNIAFQNTSKEGNLVLEHENCHVTEKDTDNLKHNGEIYQKPNIIQDSVEVVNKPIPKEKLISDNQQNLHIAESNITILQVEDARLPSPSPEISKAVRNVNVPNLPLNSSKVEERIPTEQPAIPSANLKSDQMNMIVESSMIKTATHLSDPHIKSDEGDQITILRQGALSPDAKPMKRDLKSILMPEEKSNNRKHD